MGIGLAGLLGVWLAALLLMQWMTGAQFGENASGYGPIAASWKTAAFGTSTDPGRYTVSRAADSSVKLTDSGSGKMIERGADGLVFCYTRIPTNMNFELEAVVNVDSWRLTNGEDDGFGLAVLDSVGEDGSDRRYFTNSVMGLATRGAYESASGGMVTMSLGLFARSKTGNVDAAPSDETVAAASQTITKVPLDERVQEIGVHNLIGNYELIAQTDGEAKAPEGSLGADELVTSFRITIGRDEDGYYVACDTHCDEETDAGTERRVYFADADRTMLASIDPDYVYAGFFVTRYATVTCSDIRLTGAGSETARQTAEAVSEAAEAVSETPGESVDEESAAQADAEETASEDAAAEAASARHVRVTGPQELYEAVATAWPGDVIELDAGVYQMDRPLIISAGQSGTAAAPVTLAGEAVLDFSGMDVTSGCGAAGACDPAGPGTGSGRGGCG